MGKPKVSSSRQPPISRTSDDVSIDNNFALVVQGGNRGNKLDALGNFMDRNLMNHAYALDF